MVDETTITGIMQDGEQAFVERLRAGEEEAFSALIDQYHPSLLRMARSYTRDAALAQEMAQDTWIALLDSLGRFEGRASLKTWLFRIFMNVARARLRKEGRTIPFSALAPEDEEPAVNSRRFLPRWVPVMGGHWWYPPAQWRDLPEEQAISAETRREVERAISALPEQQRAVITLRDIEGCTSDEVCNLLDLSDTNQRVLLHRARSKVRRTLDGYRGLRL